MVDLKFKVGDVVKIHGYAEKTIGAIGKITELRYNPDRDEYYIFPYQIQFLDDAHKQIHIAPYLTIFRDNELEKLSDKEAVAWLI